MSRRFAVVHEAESDFRTTTALADRVLIESVDWLDADLIAHQREWVGQDSRGRRLAWKTIPKLAREVGIRPRGHFDGEPGEADATAARRAILYLLETFSELDAILLIRDQDDQPERRVGLEQARDHVHSRAVIVIGLAIVERESWVISGFDPLDNEEEARLGSERRKLGFDPLHRSHDLTACKDDRASRSPKRVLKALCGDDHDRERRCWDDADLEVLRQRGTNNGLASYLREIQDRIAPQIGHVKETSIDKRQAD